MILFKYLINSLQRILGNLFVRIKRGSLFVLLYAFVLGAFVRCDFLEVDPVGMTSIPVFFSDMEGIRSALPGAYSKVNYFYNTSFYRYPDVAGDMVSMSLVSAGTSMVDQYNFTNDPGDATGTVGPIWRYGYDALANINNIIEYQPALLAEFPNNKDELNDILAQALFLRALMHFNICNCYAQPYNYSIDGAHLGIPIVTKTPGSDDNLKRNTVKEVYEQIVNDLDNSIELFDGQASSGPYYASLNAAYALKARIALYMENWDDVIKYSDILIDQFSLSSRENYLAMYHEMVPGDEMIFRLNGTDKSSTLPSFYSGSSPVVVPADTLISLFDDPNDIRLDLLRTLAGQKKCLKYDITTDVTDKEKHYDPIVLRLSEVYLNRAEAYLNKGELDMAAQNIKAIMARAVGQELSDITLPTSREELLSILDAERAKELCFEGFRLFDITRRKMDLVRAENTNSTVQKIAYPSDLFILPIPQLELNANPNMIPNPTVNN